MHCLLIMIDDAALIDGEGLFMQDRSPCSGMLPGALVRFLPPDRAGEFDAALSR
jgi:hypothetical protein